MNQSKDAETEEGKVKSSLIRNFVGSPHHLAHKHTHVLGLQRQKNGGVYRSLKRGMKGINIGSALKTHSFFQGNIL